MIIKMIFIGFPLFCFITVGLWAIIKSFMVKNRGYVLVNKTNFIEKIATVFFMFLILFIPLFNVIILFCAIASSDDEIIKLLLKDNKVKLKEEQK